MFNVTDQTNWMVVRPAGDMAAGESEDFRRLLIDLLENGHRQIRLDLSDVQDIDASALQVFVAVSDFLKRKSADHRLELVHAGQDIEALFRLTGLDRTYRIA